MPSAPIVLLATGGYDPQYVRFWDASTANVFRTVQFGDSQVNVMETTPNKQYLAVGGNPVIKLFEAQSAKAEAIMKFEGHTGNVTALGFPQDGSWMFSGSEDGTIKIWDTRTDGKQLESHENRKKSPINTVVLHPNNADLVVGDYDGNVRVWDMVASRWNYETCLQPNVSIQSLAVSNNGRTVVVCNNAGNAFVWKPDNQNTFDSDPEHSLGNSHKTFKVHDMLVLKCKISTDGSLLATASADKTVKIWNIQKDDHLELAMVLARHQRWVHDCVFSEDASYLVSASSDHSVYLWDLGTGEMVRHYQHDRAVTAVVLNDGTVEG